MPSSKVPIRCIQGAGSEKPSDFNVMHELEYILETENKKPWSRKTGVYHPSGITGCARALFYDRVGTPPKECIPRDLRMLFSMGHAIHDAVQSMLEKNFKSFKSEIPAYYEPLQIFGHCDGIFTDEDWLLEIKTAGDSVFKGLSKPKPEHIQQVHCYMWALDVPRCQMLYVHRSSGTFKMFPVFFDDSIWERIVQTVTYVDQCVDKNEPPPKEVNSYVCRSCKFKYECKPF